MSSRNSEHDDLLTDDVRARMRAEPPAFREIDVRSMMMAGSRRAHRRRVTMATVSALALVGVVAALTPSGLVLRTEDTGTVPSAGGIPSTPTRTVHGSATLTPEQRHDAWVRWAGCLRDADIPGVTVVGPPADSDEITYTDGAGTALPTDYRHVSGEWGSATEFCAEKVPELMPELEQKWGDLTAGPARDAARLAEYQRCLTYHDLTAPADRSESIAAEQAGCVWAPYDPDLDRVLQCRPGDEPSGTRAIWDKGPWQSPKDAGTLWLSRQSDRAEFASVEVIPNDGVKQSLRMHADDGRLTGVVYLLVNTFKGYRLQGMNVCQPTTP